MGTHYAFDLAAPGNQTWNAATQLPILPMYDAKRHTINAILFNGKLHPLPLPELIFWNSLELANNRAFGSL